VLRPVLDGEDLEVAKRRQRRIQLLDGLGDGAFLVVAGDEDGDDGRGQGHGYSGRGNPGFSQMEVTLAFRRLPDRGTQQGFTGSLAPESAVLWRDQAAVRSVQGAGRASTGPGPPAGSRPALPSYASA